MMPATLVLRDVHVPPAPGVWPPAPGWWLAIACVALLVGAMVGWMWWRRHRVRRWQHWFDQAGQGLAAPQQVAAMSELLRRAARRVEPHADRLQGDAWLRFLDGKEGHEFSQGAGRLLLDGGFRREVDPARMRAATIVARARFLQLMAAKR